MGAHGVWAFGLGVVRGSRLLLLGLHLPLIPGTERRTGVRVRGEGSSVAPLRLCSNSVLAAGKTVASRIWNPRFGYPAGASAERVTMSGLRMLPSALSR